MIHPYEHIEVDYAPPVRPPHIVETRHVPVSGFQFPQPRTFIDDHEASCDEMAALGWGNVVKWERDTAEWMVYDNYPDKDEYAAIVIAKSRRAKVFGNPEGVYSDVTTKFEAWLRKSGWRPVMLDMLNAYCPGRILMGARVPGQPDAVTHPSMYHSHVYVKDEDVMTFQFGFGNFNFVFETTKARGTFQVPVNEGVFQDAVDGKLPNLEAIIQ